MSRKKQLLKFFAGLALGTVVVLPAATAQVKSFTDSQGVVHIKNEPETKETGQTEPKPAETLPFKKKRLDKQEKLRILYERRGQLPSVSWPEKKP